MKNLFNIICTLILLITVSCKTSENLKPILSKHQQDLIRKKGFSEKNLEIIKGYFDTLNTSQVKINTSEQAETVINPSEGKINYLLEKQHSQRILNKFLEQVFTDSTQTSEVETKSAPAIQSNLLDEEESDEVLSQQELLEEEELEEALYQQELLEEEELEESISQQELPEEENLDPEKIQNQIVKQEAQQDTQKEKQPEASEKKELLGNIQNQIVEQKIQEKEDIVKSPTKGIPQRNITAEKKLVGTIQKGESLYTYLGYKSIHIAKKNNINVIKKGSLYIAIVQPGTQIFQENGNITILQPEKIKKHRHHAAA